MFILNESAVRAIPLIIALWTSLAMPALASPPVHVGQGCSTAYFIDKDCDGYGVGVKSSGVYPLHDGSEALGSAADYTGGDLPDADDEDPTVNTTASWETKWGTDAAGMAKFLAVRKGFTNSSRIFYVSQSGNDATGAVNDPTHAYRTMGPAWAAMKDMQGGAIVIRGGKYTDLSFGACDYYSLVGCWNLSGSDGHPVYVINYPGELVITNHPYGADVNYAPSPNVGNVTIDGLEFIDPKYGLGDAISITDTDHMTFINDEFAGWHQTSFGNHSEFITVSNNVFHDMMYHTIYFLFCCGITDNNPNGDFDFALDAKNYAAGIAGAGASHDVTITGNVMFSNGAGGYEPIHLNTFLNRVDVEKNIVSYSGGTAMALMTGIYNAKIKNNVFFDNGRDAFTMFLYDAAGFVPATLRWITFENNTLYVGNSGDNIRGTNPSGGIVAKNSSADKTHVHHIKDVTVRNNIIVTDSYSTHYANWPFYFRSGSNPDTWIIENNIVANDHAWTGTPSGSRPAVPADQVFAVLDPDTYPDGHGAGTYTLEQFQAGFPKAKANLSADPKFTAASNGYTLTPELFNLRPKPDSPAKNYGAAAGAPSDDVTGAERHPSAVTVGAYQ